MTITIREIKEADISDSGQIMYDAFTAIASQHNFSPDFPGSDVTKGILESLNGAPIYDGFIAEEDGKILGSIFVCRGSIVGGISIITVDPAVQNNSVGRALMDLGMKHLHDQGHVRQQLIQAAYHNRSLCLYTKLGFTACDMLSHMIGDSFDIEIPGRVVRPATMADMEDCNAICYHVHGFERAAELGGAIHMEIASVVELDGEISGYNTGAGFVGHGVGRTNDDVKAMICANYGNAGRGIMIPTANGELFRWCLDNGLRLNQQLTLMDTAPTGPANGAYWPNILC